MRGFTSSEKRVPVEPAMQLDVGRLTITEALAVGGVALAALFVAALGGLLAWAAGPRGWETLGGIGGLRFWVWLFGTLVSLVSFWLGVVVVRLTVRSWNRYEQRLQEWHDAAVAAFEDSEGQAVETTVTRWELSASVPRDVLLVALAVHSQVQAGERNAHTVRALGGDLWLGGLRLGDVAQAERMSRTLADLGLIEGKAQRKAGEWVPSSADEVLTLVQQNWSRVGRRD